MVLGVAKPSIVNPADIKGAVVRLCSHNVGTFMCLPLMKCILSEFQVQSLYSGIIEEDAGTLFTYDTTNFYNLETILISNMFRWCMLGLTLNKLCNLQADTGKLMTDDIAKVVHPTNT